MNRPFVSIIMPALNEEEGISLAVSNIREACAYFKVEGEIIIVNDGSSDKTPDIAKKLMSEPGAEIRLINHQTSQGIGASFWDGVDAAAGEAVCMLPADNENDAREILRYLKLLDDVDIVLPFAFNKGVRGVFRDILSYLYLKLINSSFGFYFNYTNGTVLYRKSLLKSLDYHCRSFFFQTDILVRLAKRGYLFAEVPYSLGLRKGSGSKAVSFSSFFKIAKGYGRLIKDLYFRKEYRVKKYKLCEDSLSSKRRQNLK